MPCPFSDPVRSVAPKAEDVFLDCVWKGLDAHEEDLSPIVAAFCKELLENVSMLRAILGQQSDANASVVQGFLLGSNTQTQQKKALRSVLRPAGQEQFYYNMLCKKWLAEKEALARHGGKITHWREALDAVTDHVNFCENAAFPKFVVEYAVLVREVDVADLTSKVMSILEKIVKDAKGAKPSLEWAQRLAIADGLTDKLEQANSDFRLVHEAIATLRKDMQKKVHGQGLVRAIKLVREAPTEENAGKLAVELQQVDGGISQELLKEPCAGWVEELVAHATKLELAGTFSTELAILDVVLSAQEVLGFGDAGVVALLSYMKTLYCVRGLRNQSEASLRLQGEAEQMKTAM
eukprot:5796619-Amphidinium_carterae.2